MSVIAMMWKLICQSLVSEHMVQLSGNLAPSIGNLTNLQIVLFKKINTTEPIPVEMGRLWKLQTLDVSDNIFNGEISSSLGHLKNLQYMRLNNYSLTGEIQGSLANLTRLT
ncbi:protein NSP-INTERACTING KINASE 3-like [Heracleum sosnowskyi]|uniref:Protein NSP-INTERACTING KINASE 3-like n=1 Tax=Heracleum sosnowskyi TaxID=360622 RepID=A0AAD8MTJ9_9APIA|nr:protein NSP-INTERACTING KINASE 3-like [Heracleum sosnowskyi]